MSTDGIATEKQRSLSRRAAPWVLGLLALLAWLAAPVAWRATQIMRPRATTITNAQSPENDPVTLRFSDDGRSFVAYHKDSRKLIVWDVLSGNKREVENVAPALFPRLRYSPDGAVIAAEKAGDSIRVWDIASGREIAKIPAGEKANADPELSPDGKRLLTQGKSAAPVTEAQTLSAAALDVLPALFRAPLKMGLPVSRAKKEVQTVQVWDLASGKVVLTLSEATKPRCKFSSDGSALCTWVTERRQPTKLQVHNLATGQLVGTVAGASTDPGSYALSADARKFITRQGGWANFFDVATDGQPKTYLIDRPGDLFSAGLVMSPDGNTLAVVRMNLDRVMESRSPVRVPIQRPSHPPGLLDEFLGRAPVPSPSEAAQAGKAADEKSSPEVVPERPATGVEFFDAPSGERLMHVPYAEISAFLPDGKTLASYYPDEQTVKLWDVPPRPIVPTFGLWALLATALVLTIVWWSTLNRRPAWDS